MTNITLAPRNKTINTRLHLPGSKSIANRVLLLAAIAHGTSLIHNVPDVSEDVNIMLKALESLGVRVNKVESYNKNSITASSSYEIEGCGGEFRNKTGTIFCGNSGTTLRFLTAMLALMPGTYQLTGVERMKERPIGDLIDTLNELGADITYLEEERFPPIRTNFFHDKQSSRIGISGKVSSQYLTGLLMALPLLNREISVRIVDELISRPYIEITRALLAKFGCKVESLGTEYLIRGDAKLQAIEYTIEPDASSASYFLACGAINGKARVDNLSATSLQGDKDFAKVLEKMGAKVDYMANSIMVRAQDRLKGVTVDMQQMPDVAMTIAVLALFAEGDTTINGIASWKVKETDRLKAMYNELTKLGAKVSITDSSITITPPSKINSNVAVDTYEDHRMAMCFSLVAVYGEAVTINDYECVGKTFSNYFTVFEQLCYS